MEEINVPAGFTIKEIDEKNSMRREK